MTILSRTKRPFSTGDKSRTIFRTVNPATLGEMRRSGRTPSRTKARCVRLFEGSLSLGESPNERGTFKNIIVHTYYQNVQAIVSHASTTTNSQYPLTVNQVSVHQADARCVENFSNLRVARHHNYSVMGTMTMSQLLAKTGNRLNALGYVEASPRKPLQALDARGKLLVEYQVYGCPHELVRQYTRAAPTGEEPNRRVQLQPGWPLTLEEACDVLRIKRRNGRWISRQPVFQREFAEQLESLRSGMKAKALIAQGEILADRGDGSAADRKVRLQASQAILRDDGRASSVNVVVNNGIQLSAGIVIRLPHDASSVPLEAMKYRE